MIFVIPILLFITAILFFRLLEWTVKKINIIFCSTDTYTAIAYGNYRKSKKFIEEEEAKDPRFLYTIILWAINHHRIKIINLVLKKGVDPTTVIQFALSSGYEIKKKEKILKILLGCLKNKKYKYNHEFYDDFFIFINDTKLYKETEAIKNLLTLPFDNNIKLLLQLLKD